MMTTELDLTNDAQAIGALLYLYNRQKPDAQAAKITGYESEMGFNATDTHILTSISEFYLERGYLTERQLATVKRRIQKYHKQFEGAGIQPAPIKTPGKKEKKEKIMRVTVENEQYIHIQLDYDPVLISKIKTLSYRSWISSKKVWRVSRDPENLQKLKEWGFEIPDELIVEEKKKIKINSIKGFKGKLRPFQKTGVEFIEDHDGRVLLADEMGLGKTIQVCAWLQYRKELRPAVVVCPASLKLNWQKEIRQWMDDDEKCIVVSGKSDSVSPFSTFPKEVKQYKDGIIIVNYDILASWVPVLKEMKAQVMVFDESHYVKNRKAIRTKASEEMSKGCKHVICVSGTPIINRPIELYTSISMIKPLLFPNFMQFATRYCGAKQTSYGWDFNGAQNTEELHNILTNTIMIRRLKKDVLQELPAKSRSVIPLEITNRRDYSIAESEFIAWVAKFHGKEKALRAQRAETLTRIEYLKQLAVKGKMEQCLDWVKDFLNQEEKLVVFCTHTETITELRKAFKKSVYIDGSVSTTERQQAVEQFQNNKSTQLFIGNIKAAGTGITLTAASNVAFMELGWTPGEHDQAEDRVHRMGQEAESINVYYLVAQKTIESEICGLLDEKRKVLTSILDGDTVAQESILTELLLRYR